MSVLWWLFTALWASALVGFVIVCALDFICWAVGTVKDWFR